MALDLRKSPQFNPGEAQPDPSSPCFVEHWFDEEGLSPWARADIDFVVVAQTEAKARSKIEDLLKSLRHEVGDCRCFETPNSVTLVPRWPFRHVQVIKLFTRSLAEYERSCASNFCLEGL